MTTGKRNYDIVVVRIVEKFRKSFIESIKRVVMNLSEAIYAFMIFSKNGMLTLFWRVQNSFHFLSKRLINNG